LKQEYIEPQMNADQYSFAELTEQIIGCFYEVSNALGCGFLEKVYENAVTVALRKSGLSVQQQVRFVIMYEGVEVGEYIADLVVENRILVELKAVKALDEIHTAQCINLLRASNLRVCLLANFGKPKVEVKRIVNERTR
jgi:GxxExxY protein